MGSLDDLLSACREGNVELVSAILAEYPHLATAQPHDEDGVGDTPLHEAARGGHLRVATLLVQKGADPSKTGRHGLTPLHRAAEGLNEDCANVIRMLVQHGIDVDIRSLLGSATPLHYAAREHNIRNAQHLLELGADINAKDCGDSTPLHYACRNVSAAKGSEEMVTFLLERGAEVDPRDNYHRTPLHYAVMYNQSAVKPLIAAGADVNRRDREGKSPFLTLIEHDIMGSFWNPFTYEEFLAAGADVNATDKDGNTALRIIEEYRTELKERVYTPHSQFKVIKELMNFLKANGARS